MAQGEHDDDVDDAPFRSPLPPDDRLWRHPSEVDEHGLPRRRSARVGKLLTSLFSRERP